MCKNIISILVFCAFILMLTGMPLQLLHIDSVKSAYAMGSRHHQNHPYYGSGNGSDNGDANGSGNGDVYQVPEPTTISLIGTGLAGIGIYVAVRRRNRK